VIDTNASEEVVDARPTGIPVLDDLLARLASGARDVLGSRFLGLYLVGSFALGAGDEHSDVDFVAAVSDTLTEAEASALEALHARLFELPTVWAQHLEGSYIPVDALRAKASAPRRFVFFDNGAISSTMDDHDDSHVLRWVLREHGITIEGPDPRTLVDEVTDDQLRAESAQMLCACAAWAPEPCAVGRMSRWKQTYLVVTVCRIALTRSDGHVPSKPEALAWGIEHVPGRWRSLIERATIDRPDPWRRVHENADDALVDETLAFVQWATTWMDPGRA
jgi:hypothetical protein